MNISKHASLRQQQRCIPPLIIDWLLDFGEQKNDGRGCSIRFFTKKSRKLISRKAGSQVVGLLSRYMDSYLVESNDGTIVTMGYRFKRVKH